MNEFQMALAVGCLITAIFAWRVPRAILWICTGAASFVLSTAWARYNLPMPPLFTACCDAAVCLLIYAYARRLWELTLYRLFQGSVMVSLIYFALAFIWPKVASHALYVTILEAINWLALLLILGTGTLKWVGAYGDRAVSFGSRPVRWAREALFSPRTPHRWWEK